MIVTLTLNPAVDVSTATTALKPGDKLRCCAPRYDPGGGGINVARAIHALDGRATAIYPAGGLSGRLLFDLLQTEGVVSHPIEIAAGTRQNFTVSELESGQQYRFVMPGADLTAAELSSCLDALGRVSTNPAYIVASGSLPPNAPSETYGMVAEIASRLGAKLVLDTSGEALQIAHRTRIYLCKPNRAELESLTRRRLASRQEIVQAAKELAAEGNIEVVVVSLGAEGAVVVAGGEAEFFPAIPVQCRSTVGAGDSMIAGIVLTLSQGKPLKDGIRVGMAAGAAALLRPGTELCEKADVERLLALAA